MNKSKHNKSSLPPIVKDHLKTLGDNIKDARLARGWSQNEMAERALISRTTYNDIENGVETVQIKNYLLVLNVFNLTSQVEEIAAPHKDVEGRMLRFNKGKQ